MGTRRLLLWFIRRTRDHPHAYGDKFNISLLYGLFKGSSPRVWGQVHINNLRTINIRIIPTRMGTRTAVNARYAQATDHPHAYGDKQHQENKNIQKSGSSPRVWGQGPHTMRTAIVLRIIPTRMGTRLKKSRKIAVLQNQPLRFPLTFHRSFV